MSRLGLFLDPPKGSLNSSKVKNLMNGFTGFTGQGVTVAVLDSGVNDNHPALKGKIISKIDLTDGNDPNDYYGHGTHVASVIAGNKLSTRYGLIEGMAPHARIHSIKVFDDKGNGKNDWIARGLMEAVRLNVDLVNISGGGYSGTQEEKDAVDLLASKNTMVVSAMGNDGFGSINYPAGFKNSIAVGTMANGSRVGFSSIGPGNDGSIKPDIMAYGIDVASAATGWLDGWYDNVKDGIEPMSGTSVSTPYITGALAQLIEANGGRLNRQEIEMILKASGCCAKNNYKGYGMMDVSKAINSLKYLKKLSIHDISNNNSGLFSALTTIAAGSVLAWWSER